MGSKAPRAELTMPSTLWFADTIGIQSLIENHAHPPTAAMKRAIHWHRYELTPTRKPKKPKSRRARRRKV